MTTTSTPPIARHSGAALVLDRLVAVADLERHAAVEKLRLAADWAHAHPGVEGDCASWEPGLLPEDLGCEDGLDRLGGEGTPPVAEFAVEHLAGRLCVSTGHAMQLVADALDLAHRHPVLWTRVLAGACPAWVGRKVARACTTLPAEAAGWVDARVGPLVGAVGWPVVEARIAYARAHWDPDRCAQVEHTARDARTVEIRFPGLAQQAVTDTAGGLATADLHGVLDTVDAVKFEALVAEKATHLARAGDADPLPIRRARALGLIADELLTGTLALPDPNVDSGGPAADVEVAAVGGPGNPPGPMPRPSCLPATLYLHLTAEDLRGHGAGQARLGSVEQLGPATLELLADWLARTDLTIKPVLDMGRTDAVDVHDPPGWMRELVILRDRHCCFPWCARDARTCDLDHIEAYLPSDEGGPPGQTRPDNLAPLCRRHHRCKTFTRWRYGRGQRDGTYEWTDPGGRRYLVDPATGTTTPHT